MYYFATLTFTPFMRQEIEMTITFSPI